MRVIDEATNFQRARRPELMLYCRDHGINVAGDATKDDMLKVIGAAPLINDGIPAPRAPSDPDLGSHPETTDEKRTRLIAQLAELEPGPKIMTSKVFAPRGPLEDAIHKINQMQHHERKKWLAKACEENGFENRFPGPRGKGPEVLDECIRIRTEIG